MSSEEDKSLKKLREIFFADNIDKQEQFEKELEELRFRTSDKESKIQAYYPIITDLLERKIIDSEDELAKVLSPLMGKAIKKQVTESKDDIIEALYPIMGETIKRSVAESIKEVYTSINLKIDNALRRGIFSKQIKSKITGVSATDLILQDSFPFRVEEIFLIHEQSGILISHVSSEDNKSTTDGDIISGMLTAIKDFVSDSFKSDTGTQNLYEIQYGNSRIILERGLYSYLAIVTSGQEPVDFHSDLSDLSASMYKNYYRELREFDGDISSLKDINKPILKFVKRFKKVKKVEIVEKPKPLLFYLLLGILGIITFFWAVFTLPIYFSQKTTNDLILSKIKTLKSVNVENIIIDHVDSNVKITGLVNSYHTKNSVDSVLKTIPEVKSYNNELSVIFKNVPQEKIVLEIDKIINSLATDKITYQINGDKIIVDGEIESEELKHQFAYKISNIDGVRIVVNNLNVSNISWEESRAIIESSKIYFEFGKSELSELHISNLNEIPKLLSRYSEAKLIINGYSDGAKTASNLAMAKERAEHVRAYFITNGIATNRMELKFSVISDKNIKQTNNRKVELRVES